MKYENQLKNNTKKNIISMKTKKMKFRLIVYVLYKYNYSVNKKVYRALKLDEILKIL